LTTSALRTSKREIDLSHLAVWSCSQRTRPNRKKRSAYGRCLIWVYGREGNGLYLGIAQPLRWLTRRLPVRVNDLLAALLYWPALVYAGLAQRMPLPMSGYLKEVFLRFDPAQRRLVILDLINPAWAKYYTQTEAEGLLRSAGFADIRSRLFMDRIRNKPGAEVP
jgi:hypothetical protein